MHYAPPGHAPHASAAFPYAVEKFGQLYISAGTPIARHACAKCGGPPPLELRKLRIVHVPEWIILVLMLYPFLRKVRSLEIAICLACAAKLRAAKLRLLATPVAGGLGIAAMVWLVEVFYPTLVP